MNYDRGNDQPRLPIRNDVKTRNLSEKKRRDQFNMLINELCSMVSTNNRKMDKSTVLKSTIAFLKNYQEISVQSQAHEIKENWKPSFLTNDEFTQLMLEALDSFLLVFSQAGTILYASESITSLLGHLPGDIVNRSIFDLIHGEEKINLCNLISSHSSGENKDQLINDRDGSDFTFNCHLKRGRLQPTDEQIYERVNLAGNVRLWNGDPSGSVDSDDDSSFKNSDFFNSKSDSHTVCFCCTVRLETSQLIREMSIIDDIQTQFTSRHSMEWKFLFLDHRAPPIIGYLPFELLGTSGYDYYHPDDLEKISNCHEQLMVTGEGKSCPYRFLTKGQQWIWLKTRFYITYHQWNCKPEFIVCTHTLISYADVRAEVWKVEGEEDSHTETSHCRSPSAYSVTSAGQGDSKWSSTASVRSSTPDGLSTGAVKLDGDSQQKPHSTAQLSPHAGLAPDQMSPLSTHQPQTEGIVVPGSIFLSPSSNLQSPSMVCQSPTSSATSLAHSTSPAINSPTSPLLPSQVYLTPAQHHLHKQLQQKSQLLQQAILQQQAELQQINNQLALSKTLTMPQQSAVKGEEPGHGMLQPPQGYCPYPPVPSFSPELSLSVSSPLRLSESNSQPVQLHMTPTIQQQTTQSQFLPFQFLQPQAMYSPLNSLSRPSNPPPE